MTQYQKTLGPLQGMAMTVTTFIGTGLMILPAMSVAQAGSFAFYAWLITAAMIIPIAFIFALLGAKYPSAGGASHYIGRAFGGGIEKAVGWLFLSILLVGPAVAIKVAAAYLSIIFNVTENWILTFSLITLVGMMVFAMAGIQTSARFQSGVVIAMIATINLLCLLGDIQSSTQVITSPSNLADWQTTLYATGVIFWCFLGIEVMAHMGAEFKNPTRDFPIALLGGIAIVILAYLSLVLLIAWHQTYGDEVTNSQSLALLVSKLLGDTGSRIFALGAYVIAFANVAIYILGFSRMVQSMAQQGALPSRFNQLNAQGAPAQAVLLVCAITLVSILFSELSGWKMAWFIEMTNGSFLLIYTLTCIAAIKLLNKQLKLLALLALCSCVFMAFFIGENMLFAAIMFCIALSYEWIRSIKNSSKCVNLNV
ncbi:L-methionine/branched-chain amino acid transporter [Marinomonas posidonica]|uniref:Amino acid permease-associated region n=1 Tax=Marinomonas posidonica (strain CECT 7376 / NCIMB 14433 / IVIA-Po-181) TaxID=491952 RepID=F6CXJ5_MARPP|nr:L-methionine/branched-chain amino acid transporter [Marinomonas posidonica]AEF55611.1 amino acid permease-associated region [Marinomonas posidonica IVIA-Po-181]